MLAITEEDKAMAREYFRNTKYGAALSLTMADQLKFAEKENPSMPDAIVWAENQFDWCEAIVYVVPDVSPEAREGFERLLDFTRALMRRWLALNERLPEEHRFLSPETVRGWHERLDFSFRVFSGPRPQDAVTN